MIVHLTLKYNIVLGVNLILAQTLLGRQDDAEKFVLDERKLSPGQSSIIQYMQSLGISQKEGEKKENSILTDKE